MGSTVSPPPPTTASSWDVQRTVAHQLRQAFLQKSQPQHFAQDIAKFLSVGGTPSASSVTTHPHLQRYARAASPRRVAHQSQPPPPEPSPSPDNFSVSPSSNESPRTVLPAAPIRVSSQHPSLSSPSEVDTYTQAVQRLDAAIEAMAPAAVSPPPTHQPVGGHVRTSPSPPDRPSPPAPGPPKSPRSKPRRKRKGKPTQRLQPDQPAADPPGDDHYYPPSYFAQTQDDGGSYFTPHGEVVIHQDEHDISRAEEVGIKANHETEVLLEDLGMIDFIRRKGGQQARDCIEFVNSNYSQMGLASMAGEMRKSIIESGSNVTWVKARSHSSIPKPTTPTLIQGPAWQRTLKQSYVQREQLRCQLGVSTEAAAQAAAGAASDPEGYFRPCRRVPAVARSHRCEATPQPKKAPKFFPPKPWADSPPRCWREVVVSLSA